MDVYPTRNGEPVPDLERADLELLEDGVPQTIEQFERISLQTTTDRESRRDPNTVAESREQAARSAPARVRDLPRYRHDDHRGLARARGGRSSTCWIA